MKLPILACLGLLALAQAQPTVLPFFNAVHVCAPVYLVVYQGSAANGSVAFTGESSAVATLGATVIGTTLFISFTPTALNTTQPLVGNLTLPSGVSDSGILAIVSQWNSRVLLAPGISVPNLMVVADDSTMVTGNVTAANSTLGATDNSLIALEGNLTTVLLHADDNAKIGMYGVSSSAYFISSDNAAVGIDASPTTMIAGNAVDNSRVYYNGPASAKILTSDNAVATKGPILRPPSPTGFCFKVAAGFNDKSCISPSATAFGGSFSAITSALTGKNGVPNVSQSIPSVDELISQAEKKIFDGNRKLLQKSQFDQVFSNPFFDGDDSDMDSNDANSDSGSSTSINFDSSAAGIVVNTGANGNVQIFSGGMEVLDCPSSANSTITV